MLKLDGEGLNELYKRGVINSKQLKKINIINYYEARAGSSKRHAVRDTAKRFGCTVQNIYRVIKSTP
jgi:Mor family transcriptional regulator